MNKKTFLRRTLFFLMCLYGTSSVCALEVTIDGLVYDLSGNYATVSGLASGNTNQVIEIPSSVNYDGLTYTVKKIGGYAFYDNKNITSVVIPEGVIEIEGFAFSRTLIASIHLPSTIQTIGEYAFGAMEKLTSIVIPSSVTSFYGNIFKGCDLLRTIIYTGATPPTNWVATSQTYVPDVKKYNSPQYSINSAQVLPMIKWGKTTFEYSGKAPEVEWTNNVDGYTATLDTSTLKGVAGTTTSVIPTTFTNGEETFTTNVSFKYTIRTAPLVVKVNDASRTYGENNPVFSCSYDGFVNNEDASVFTNTPTLTTTANANSDVGTYTITASGGKAKNYQLTYEQGTLTVLPAILTVTVNDATREYGDENPAFILTYSGLKNDETEPTWTTAPSFLTEATAKSDVETYEVDVTAEPKNYTITTKQAGTLTVTQAPLMLKADDATRPYFSDDPEFTFTCEGFKNDDNASVLTVQPTFIPDAIKRSYVGTYDLNVEGAEAKNYNISYVPATLTITPRPLYVKVNDANRVYGDQNPSFELTYEGFVNNETEQVLTQIPTITTAATVNSDAGTYDLYVGGGKATNYDLSYQQGQLTVTQRPLTVSVGDYERDYGEENPAFELIYDNFGSSDDETSLVSKPVARTTATRTSDVGTYAINVTGGASPNYTFTYVPGLLTVNRADQTFTWEQDLSELRVGDQVELKAFASSGLPVTFTFADNDIVDVYQAGRKTYMECLKPGTIVIKAQQEGNKNYYPTQRITKTIVVNVATSVDAAEKSTLRVHPTSFGIRILNASNENAKIYTADGVLVKSVKVAGEQTDIELPANRVYLVKIGDKTVKVMR